MIQCLNFTLPVQLSTHEIAGVSRYIPYAKAAFCHQGQGLKQWECEPCAGNNTDSVSTLGDFWADAFGFIGVDHDDQKIVVSFRGTRTLHNIISDVKILVQKLIQLVKAPFEGLPPNASVHVGFWEAYQTLRVNIIERVAGLRILYRGYIVLVVGHSLGGALAYLCAADLLTLGNPFLSYPVPPPGVQIIKFNSPRIGNAAFAQWFAGLDVDSLRVVNQDDLTPHLPPIWMGYMHVGTEVWVKDSDGKTLKCPGSEHPECSNSLKYWNVLRHNFIWGNKFGPDQC